MTRRVPRPHRVATVARRRHSLHDQWQRPDGTWVNVCTAGDWLRLTPTKHEGRTAHTGHRVEVDR